MRFYVHFLLSHIDVIKKPFLGKLFKVFVIRISVWNFHGSLVTIQVAGRQNLEKLLPLPVAYSEPCQTSKMKRFPEIVNCFQPLTIFTKRSILDI